MDGREDMSNLLLLMCYKGGGCIVESHDNILMLLVSIMMPLDWGNYIIFSNQPGYGWLGCDY